MADIDVYKEWLGIPEGDRPPDHYTLLRLVMFEDSADKVRSNYRKLNAHIRKFATGQYLKPSQDLLNELAKAMLCLTDPEAKREYDASLGRDFSDSPTAAHDETVNTLQFLVSKDVIKRGQVDEIEHFADARGLTHRDAVVQMKLANVAEATQALAAELRLSYIDLQDMLPEDDVLDGLPRSVVKRHTCLPLFEDGGQLLVACAHEPTPDLEDEVRLRFGMSMRAVLAVPRQVNQAIAKYYAPGSRTEAAPVSAGKPGTKAGKGKKKKDKVDRGSTAPLTDEERANRRNISLIAICWSVLVPMVALSLATDLSGLLRFAIAFGCGAVVAGVLKASYWK